MDSASACFDSFAKGSVSGFTLGALLSFIMLKKPSRFGFMIFGAGLGGGYGAFDCSKDFMHFSVNEQSKLYLGIDFSQLMKGSSDSSSSDSTSSKKKAPAELEIAVKQVKEMEEKEKKADS